MEILFSNIGIKDCRVVPLRNDDSWIIDDVKKIGMDGRAAENEKLLNVGFQIILPSKKS